MVVRHCVEESNTDKGPTVRDATRVRHVSIERGAIVGMSGWVDKATHLNLDFPDHRVIICAIAERLEIGAKVRLGEGGLLFAKVDPSAYGHYGAVDYTKRYLDMREALGRRVGRGGEP